MKLHYSVNIKEYCNNEMVSKKLDEKSDFLDAIFATLIDK
jgi:hypothetical protein